MRLERPGRTLQPHNPPRGRAAYRTGHRPEPLDNELIWHKLYTDTFWAKGNGAIIFSAISAIDIAHWDIKGKAAGMPLNQMLGGMQRDGLPEYLSHIQFVLGGPTLDPLFTPAEYADGCRRAVDLGYTAVKINPFRTDEDGRVIHVCRLRGSAFSVPHRDVGPSPHRLPRGSRHRC